MDVNGNDALATSNVSVATDFQEDPFKDYRYEDVFSIEDPFNDEVSDAKNVQHSKDTEVGNSRFYKVYINLNKNNCLSFFSFR
jgi:hypothetical protein